MSFERLIALRYLTAKRKQAFISVISLFSVLGVALGVASLIVAMGIMNGFTTDLRDKILGANSQIVIYGSFAGLADYEALRQKALTVPDVVAATPFIYTEVMLSAPGGVKGLILRGIDPQSAPAVLSILRSVEPKSGVAELETPAEGQPPLPGIIIGKELSARLALVPGSRVNLLSPSGERSAAGFNPRIRPFVVTGVFATGMIEYDSTLAFVSLSAARNLINMPQDQVSGLELLTNDLFSADKTAAAVQAALGDGAPRVRNWMETNANLFAALKLEKIAMGIVLTLIVLVGSFSIVATLVMLVTEKRRDIAIMMAMGATRRAIHRIFRLEGMIIGMVGTAIGFGLGLTLCYLLKRYQFIKLPQGVYPVDYLPVLLQWQDLAIIGAGAFVICLLATLYPAWQAARLEPVEALHYE